MALYAVGLLALCNFSSFVCLHYLFVSRMYAACRLFFPFCYVFRNRNMYTSFLSRTRLFGLAKSYTSLAVVDKKNAKISYSGTTVAKNRPKIRCLDGVRFAGGFGGCVYGAVPSELASVVMCACVHSYCHCQSLVAVVCSPDRRRFCVHFQLFIELCRIRKCFTQKGGVFVLEEYGKPLLHCSLFAFTFVSCTLD